MLFTGFIIHLFIDLATVILDLIYFKHNLSKKKAGFYFVRSLIKKGLLIIYPSIYFEKGIMKIKL